MIELIYSGRLGNNVLQYSMAYLLSKELNYKIKEIGNSYFPDSFLVSSLENITSGGMEIQGPVVIYDDFTPLEEELLNKTPRKIILNGYFQKSKYYVNVKDEIKALFNFKDVCLDSDDIVVHIRKGDIANTENDLPDDYFISAIKRFGCLKNIYIISDEPEHNTVKKICDQFDCVKIATKSELDDMSLMVNANNLILSNGTFS